MADLSYKDNKYFLDNRLYNCPFCNRGSVSYKVIWEKSIDWSNDETVYLYGVQCGEEDCKMVSMHLTKYYLDVFRTYSNGKFSFHNVPFCDGKLLKINEKSSEEVVKEDFPEEQLDDLFFFHNPKSVFTIDNRINRKIRDLVAEADDCRKMNCITGATGCLRKAIFELLKYFDIPTKPEEGCDKNKWLSYEDRFRLLKEKLKVEYPKVDTDLVNSLEDIYKMASQELHEDDWNDFTPAVFDFLKFSFVKLLYEIFVQTDIKKQEHAKMVKLFADAKNPKEIVPLDDKDEGIENDSSD